MIDKRDYIVEISKLKKGHNDFEFEINKELFDIFNTDNDGNVSEDVQQVKAIVKADILKEERMLTFRFVFKGEIQTLCSRCLSPVVVPIDKKTDLYVKIAQTSGKSKVEEQDVNEWVLDENENELDIAQYLYEEMRIEIPIAPMHENEADCNEEMLDKLSQINAESSRHKDEIDPRWEKLKSLIKE